MRKWNDEEARFHRPFSIVLAWARPELKVQGPAMRRTIAPTAKPNGRLRGREPSLVLLLCF
jgi:hypothetical protein